MKSKILLMGVLSCLSMSTLSAKTLKDVVNHVLQTNPTVKERLKNYAAVKEGVNIASAGYYPTVDLSISAGRERSDMFNGGIDNIYNVFQNSLVLKQNIFDGFSTTENINYQKMQTLSAGYSYLEKANDTVLKTIEVYLEVLKQKELLKNSKTNVAHNSVIYNKVSKAFNAGLTTLSEVSKIQSSLSLAQSNMMIERNKLQNALFNFRKVTGYFVDVNELTKPQFRLSLPKSQERASMYALEYNPSIIVGNYNVKGAEALYRESKSKFMPTVDVELSETYNKDNSIVPFLPDDNFQARVVLKYNLFNGGADEASRVQKLSRLSQEVDVVDNLKREVVMGLDLSWSAYELTRNQLPYLRQYQKQSIETLKLFTKEYELGTRSLLDLLANESDVKRANDEMINAKFNQLLAKYRILDAMGLSIASIMGNVDEYYQRVGINGKGHTVKHDLLPLDYDTDKDGVASAKDLCGASENKSQTRPTGCAKQYPKYGLKR